MEKIKKIEKPVYLVLCGIFTLVIIGSIIGEARTKKIEPEQKIASELKTKPKQSIESLFVEEEKVMSSEMIEEKLVDIGFLVTQEYSFTQLEHYTDEKTYCKFLTSEKSFDYSYDGIVSAGVDFTRVKVGIDEDAKIITITIPKAEIYAVSIDKDSFKMFSEKNGFLNKLSITDFNESNKHFDEEAKKKAESNGILKRADENAKAMVVNLVTGIIDSRDYRIEYK